MPALINFSNLDFDQIKTSIRDYLRANSNFTDYDFEGSNLSVLIDVLAYNTYISSYNANMISNEVFIDSATLRENVVSLARNIGYVPSSRKAASAVVSLFVDTDFFNIQPKFITLKSGVVCNTSAGNRTYNFSIPDDVSAPVVNGESVFNNIEIYEGIYQKEFYTVDQTNKPEQRFILSNEYIDTTSIRVRVKDSATSTQSVKYNLADNILNVDSTSNVFFIQEIEDQRYEIIFGDGIFGRKLENGNFIEITYISSNGVEGNGFINFSFAGRMLDNNGFVVSKGISPISLIEASDGGKEVESVASIKRYAPRLFSSQNRAVTASDYEVIVNKIFPEVESINVFGGEELDPPQYGRVFIAIKPFYGPFVPSRIKDNITKELRNYSVAGIDHRIIDLKYLYIELNTTVYYNSNLTNSPFSIKSKVDNNVQSYADSTELNKYGARFKYSKYQKVIDDSDQAITSNITKVVMRRDISAKVNAFAEYEICYGNSFYIKNENGYNIKSSGFYIDGISTPVYISDTPNSDGLTGNVFLFRLNSDNEPIIIRKSIGFIDYEKGEVLITPIKVISTLKSNLGQPIIELSAIPKSNDVIGLQDLYLQLDINNSVTTLQTDVIESGSDISGSTYTSTSSYSNGSLVR